MALQEQYRKRLKKEFTQLLKAPPHGMQLELKEDDLYQWVVIIPGPPQSLYKGGKFAVHISLPENYPLSPPVVQFEKPIYHVNVCPKTGTLCFGFLAEDNWTATCTMEQLLQATFSLMIKPELENSFDHDVLNNYHHFHDTYNKRAKESSRSASL